MAASPLFRIIEHVVPCQHIREYPRATAGEQEDVLQLAVKQYIPIDNSHPRPGDITIIGAHANAFPKELYEPLWEELLQRARTHGLRIRSIWIADAAQEGQSGLLNADLLGNEPSWYDHARDLLHLINLKREEMPRPIVGIGHSMGSNIITNLALIHPRLFTSLILIEPIMYEYSFVKDFFSMSPVRSSSFRKDVWPSRKAAEELFKKLGFYQAWDPRVLQRWFDFGLREVNNGEGPEVTLTTSKHQESFANSRANYEGFGPDNPVVNRDTHADLDPAIPVPYPTYRPEIPNTFRRLPELRPSILYIWGEVSHYATPQIQNALMDSTGIGVGGSGGQKLGRVQKVVFEKINHLVPMERPKRTADAISTWLEAEMARWNQQESALREEWSKKTLPEKQTMDQRWLETLANTLPSKKKKNGKL